MISATQKNVSGYSWAIFQILSKWPIKILAFSFEVIRIPVIVFQSTVKSLFLKISIVAGIGK